MKILFLTSHSHLPLLRGGVELTTDNLAHRGMRAGHEVAVLSGLGKGNDWFSFISRVRTKFLPIGLAADGVCGYPVHRVWDPVKSLDSIAQYRKPDVAIIKFGAENSLAHAALAAHIPIVCYLHDASFDFKAADRPILEQGRFIANSNFTAGVFRERTGCGSVIIPPLVEPDNYRNDAPGDAVLFVNPHPWKGLEVALTLAEQCPDIPFIFVKSWGKLSDEEQEIIAQRTAELRNIEWLKPTGDMKSLYTRAKIVLAPSGALFMGKPVNFIETWGRIATEAHFSGIPVIASDQGGFPESVGPGGILVDPYTDISLWKAALRSLWDDPQRYAEVSSQALKYSQRPEIRPDKLFEDFLAICQFAAKGPDAKT